MVNYTIAMLQSMAREKPTAPHQQDPIVPYIQYNMSPTTPACQQNTQSKKRQVPSRRPRRLHIIERPLPSSRARSVEIHRNSDSITKYRPPQLQKHNR